MGCCMAPYKKRTGSGVKSTSDREQIKVSPSFFIKENELAFSELYMVGSKLGKGGYAEVKRCTHKPSTELRAVKIYSKQLYGPGKPEQGKMLEEMNILAKLDHPNVIRIFDYFEDKKSYYLVMEYCEGGELFDKIKKGVKMTEREAAKVMRQVISVLAYCHDLGIVHRDLKPENIMLDERKTELNIKIADFGTACYLDHNREAHGVIGTSLYMAPEVINSSSYNEKCDMWSCGIVMYLMLTGKTPYSEDLDEGEIKEVLKTGRLDFSSPDFQQLSWEAKDLIKKMLCTDPLKRISAIGALNHEWFENVYHEKPSENFVERLRTLTSKNIKEKRFLKLVNKFLPHKTLKFYIEKFYSLDTSHLGMINADSLSKGLSPPKNTYISFSDFLVATLDSSSIPDISLQACAKFFVNCSKTDFHTLTCPISYA